MKFMVNESKKRCVLLILGTALGLSVSVRPSFAGLLNLLAPFTPPGLYPASSSPQSVARMNAVKVYNSGVHEWKDKNLQGAAQCFQQALSFDPTMREVHGAFGQVLYDAGFYEDSFRELQTATQDFPNDGAYWCMLGLASSHLQRYDITVDAFQKYLKLKPHGSYADEAKRSIAILQHTIYGGQTDRSGSYFSEFSTATLRKWNSNMIPLRVFISDGTNVPNFNVFMANALRQSFNDWTLLSEGRIQFALVDDSSKAQICCRWTADKNELGGSAELGITHSTWQSTGNIEHAEIILLTVYESSPRPQEMLNRAKAVYLHEIGHALGLSHSGEPWDIMYPLVAPSGLEFPLTSRDKNTLLALYNTDPSGLIAKRFDASFTQSMVPGSATGSSYGLPDQGGGMPGLPNGGSMGNPNAANAFSQTAQGNESNAYGRTAFYSPASISPPSMSASNPYGARPQSNTQPMPPQNPFSSNSVNSVPTSASSPAPNFQPLSRSELMNTNTTQMQANSTTLNRNSSNSNSNSNAAPVSMDQLSALNRAAAQATARRDFDGAIHILLDARKMAPTDQIISRNLGLAFGNAANVASEAGDYGNALHNFQSAFEILKTGSERGPYDQIYSDYQSMLKKQRQH